MTFTPIETIAIILIIFATIKIIVLLIKPKAWMEFARMIYSKPLLTQIIGLILSGIVLYYLSKEINVVQIFAVIAFASLLIMVGLAPYGEWFVRKYEKYVKKGGIWKDNWFYALLWIALMIWALKEIFM